MPKVPTCETPIMFEDTIELIWTKLVPRPLIPNLPGVRPEPDYVGEILSHIKKMRWIVARVQELERNRFEVEAPLREPDGQRHFQAVMDAEEPIVREEEILTEAFYHVAWRARYVIRKKQGLGNFECPGVLMVRNKLLEHPEDQKGVVQGGFSYGRPEGPVIKGFRHATEADLYPDKGLFENAREFETNLNAALQRI